MVKVAQRPAFRIRIAVATIALLCSVAAFSRSVRDGVYSKAQAARGKTAYNEECARCHSESLNGGEGSPPLAGDDFLKKWSGKTVNDLFEITRKTMPFEDPSSLSRRQYADITAYILSVNEYPAGDKELGNAAEELSDIKIELRK